MLMTQAEYVHLFDTTSSSSVEQHYFLKQLLCPPHLFALLSAALFFHAPLIYSNIYSIEPAVMECWLQRNHNALLMISNIFVSLYMFPLPAAVRHIWIMAIVPSFFTWRQCLWSVKWCPHGCRESKSEMVVLKDTKSQMQFDNSIILANEL